MTDNITMPRQTVQQALEALENSSPDQYPEDAGVYYDAKDALRTALEQQQAEPVGEVIDERGEVDYISYVPRVGTKLYTTPPQRKPLTGELEAAFKDGWQSAKAAYGIKEGA